MVRATLILATAFVLCQGSRAADAHPDPKLNECMRAVLAHDVSLSRVDHLAFHLGTLMAATTLFADPEAPLVKLAFETMRSEEGVEEKLVRLQLVHFVTAAGQVIDQRKRWPIRISSVRR